MVGTEAVKSAVPLRFLTHGACIGTQKPVPGNGGSRTGILAVNASRLRVPPACSRVHFAALGAKGALSHSPLFLVQKRTVTSPVRRMFYITLYLSECDFSI